MTHNSFADLFIGHNQLIVLATIDVIIVYLFCTLQMSYNGLTAKYIYHARAKVKKSELWRAYLFAMAPIVYSLLPILLVLYYYNPNGDLPPPHAYLPGRGFALTLVWIHLPPIIIVFLIIFSWNIIAIIHNKKTDSFKNLLDDASLLQNEDDQVKDWDTNTKVVFRKIILQWYLDVMKEIDKAVANKNLKRLGKLLAKIEGWYIAKQRFQFFWCTKKAYAWIKKYYRTHYLGLRYHALMAYKKLVDVKN